MWDQIRSNRIRSAILVISMALLLLVLGWVLGEVFVGYGVFGLVLAGIIWIIMTLVAYYAASDIFLSVSRAHKISKKDHPRLFNVVEEMQIASGLPKMPDIYIIDTPALNAFATGRDPNHCAVAITSGLLQKLNRDELQGVIAHEMGHIKNRDVLLMTMAGVMVGTIVMLADIAKWSFIFGAMSGGGRSSRRDSSGGSGAAGLVILLVAIVLMIIAPLLAYLLYYALSRRREYLADASAAQYTRYPEGLASALEKLSQSTAELPSANRATAPMYIVNPLKKEGMKVSDLTSTHPPLSERIRILRSMGGGASLGDYDRAFRQVHKGAGGVVPRSALKGGAVGPAPARGVGVPEQAFGMVPPAAATVGGLGLASSAGATAAAHDPAEIDRARETSDVLWRVNNYTSITCKCGTKFRIPPKFKAESIKCPHCGTVNPMPKESG